MTVKEDILEYLNTETENDLQKNYLTFNTCNAQVIAKALYQDRANISRLLNELYREKKLIKKIGRPTTFISKSVIINYYPFSNVPDVLSKDENIADYLSFDINHNNVSLTKSFHIIGANQDGSLFNVMNRILPVFYMPTSTIRTLVFQGMDGSGKKFFFQQLHTRFIELGILKKDDEIQYVTSNYLLENFYTYVTYLKSNPYYSVVIQVLDNKSTDVQKIIELFELAYMTDKIKPILCFLYSSIQNEEEISRITPLYGIFPSFQSKSQIEMLDLLILFVKKEAERQNKEIKLSKYFIEQLLSRTDRTSILERNVQYIVSTTMVLNNQKGNQDYISLHYDSIANCLPASKIIKSISFNTIPNTISILPKQAFHISDIVPLNQKENVKQASQRLNYEIHLTPTQLFINYIQDYERNIKYRNLKEEKYITSLQKGISKMFPHADSLLLEKIVDLVFSISNDDTKYTDIFFNIPSSVDLSFLSLGSLQKAEKLAASAGLKLSTTQQYKIRNVISHTASIINDVNIPILLVSKYESLIHMYAKIFNTYKKKLCVYTFQLDNKENISNQMDTLCKYAINIDKGNGVIILTTDEAPSEISRRFFVNSKTIVFTTTLTTFAIIKK